MEDYRTKLIREFDELKAMETNAGNLYHSILPSIIDDDDRQTLTGIINDEARHASLVQGIIDLLES